MTTRGPLASRSRRALGAAVVALTIGVGSPAAQAKAPTRSCGDVTANAPNAGAFDVTTRVASCEVARGVAVRWYFRDEHRPFGYRCDVTHAADHSTVHCRARANRLVTFRYYRH